MSFPLEDYPPVKDCFFLTGPTASGKTKIALALAESLQAEIVSLDSMAVYRGMDIGTAKPTPEERAEIPHHLIDLITPREEFSLAQYVRAAHETTEDLHRRGQNVLFVGGTPLYLKALLRGLFQGPAADEALRSKLDSEARREPAGHLHRRLETVDPEAAARLHPNDTRRLIRALEVYETTGRPISEFQRQFEEEKPHCRNQVLVLSWPRDTLHHRIHRRVDLMIEQGLVDEVEQLLDQYAPLGKTASQAVGYREILRYFEDGYSSLEEAAEAIKLHTRRFAKRQKTWFRSLHECRWIERDQETDELETVRKISARIDLPPIHGD
jgi:tRNA dimethylallyltransferase